MHEVTIHVYECILVYTDIRRDVPLALAINKH